MYQENDDMLEVNDFDDDIRRREELIEEAKNITATEDWNEVMRQVNDLRKRWRRIPSWESAYEEKLTEEFDSYIDAFYAKRRESVKYNPIRWTCFYVEIKSTYFTSSKMRYSASICGMDKKKNR